MTNRTELANLYQASKAAYDKVKRNAHKLAWMDATRRMGAEVIYFEGQLAGYEAEYNEATAKFRAALATMNWNTEQVVEFINENEGEER